MLVSLSWPFAKLAKVGLLRIFSRATDPPPLDIGGQCACELYDPVEIPSAVNYSIRIVRST